VPADTFLSRASACRRPTMSRSLFTPSHQVANDGRGEGAILKGGRLAVDPTGVAIRLRDPGRAQDGFTLIEVLVSALIVTLIAGAVGGALMTNIKATGDQHRRTDAQALAEQDQERLKGLSAEQLDNLNQSYTSTQDKYKFTVSSQAYYLNSTSGASCSASGGAGATYFKTISTVTWTNPAGVAQSLATDESVITPPAGGSVLAQFHDQTTAPLSGVSVSATGPESDAATSDGNGCTIFTGLDTGAYNLTFADNGYVDPNGNASPLTDTTTVASTGIATPSKGNPIEMGLGGGINATFAIAGTSPVLAFKSPALSWYGSGGGYSMSNYRNNDPTGSSSYSTLPTTTMAADNQPGAAAGGLFPFASLNPTSYTNNYQLWAGTCRQEQPPAGTDAASVTPGLVINGMSVTAPAVDVNVTYKPQVGAATQVAPTDVKPTFTADANSGQACGDTWGPFSAINPPLVGANRVSPSPLTYMYPAPFASSATSGSTASASGQTGTVKVCADYTTGGKTYQATSAAFTDTFGSVTAVPTIAIQWTNPASGPC
jgi:prepilin-type N-terminal cleavage/methylation domain-containing protein